MSEIISLLNKYTAEFNDKNQEVIKNDIVLDTKVIALFGVYFNELVEWNKKFNLTRIVQAEDVVIKHFLDSLSLSAVHDFYGNKKVVDIGTGAGFPGVPLKIQNQGIDITLLDSLKKRLIFLEDLSKTLGIKTQVIHARAEELGVNERFRESYDIGVSRALASLNVLSEYVLPFVKKGGFFLAMKGPEPELELKEAKKSITLLGGKIVDVKKINLPKNNSRSIVLIEKVLNTPPKYPRHGSKIAKSPL